MAVTGTQINGITGTLNGDSIVDENGELQITVSSDKGVQLPRLTGGADNGLLYLDNRQSINLSADVGVSQLVGVSITQLNRREVSLFDYFADANNGTTVETTLYTNNITNQLATNGDKIIFDYGGIYTGAAASTQELRMKFAGITIFDSGALSIGAVTSTWRLSGMIMRESSTVVRSVVEYSSSNAVLSATATYTRVTGLTLSASQTINITGQAAGVGAASNQITSKLGNISYLAH